MPRKIFLKKLKNPEAEITDVWKFALFFILDDNFL